MHINSFLASSHLQGKYIASAKSPQSHVPAWEWIYSQNLIFLEAWMIEAIWFFTCVFTLIYYRGCRKCLLYPWVPPQCLLWASARPWLLFIIWTKSSVWILKPQVCPRQGGWRPVCICRSLCPASSTLSFIQAVGCKIDSLSANVNEVLWMVIHNTSLHCTDSSVVSSVVRSISTGLVPFLFCRFFKMRDFAAIFCVVLSIYIEQVNIIVILFNRKPNCIASY